ncbi:putative chagasin family peptidase inhibitor I42 [Vitreoscilla sp. C1]|uniref:protease inhibitor I42 family protein n=1 Tax=Vitreoscilla sp. (strain C1) TaxID=96942 RepID=UPI000CDC0D4C|nr:protease inhibitor I42 family protein [Vitreoscilla sp. C1]AUZ05680.1 putative chagasin family peptidase inhibitor I42 [Vitreoscilla sp. C1]
MKFVNRLAVLTLATVAASQAYAADDAKCPQTMKVGDTFEVSLETNASTGFQWQIHEKTDNVTVVSNRIQSSPSDSNMPLVGVPSQQLWVFKADAAGHAKIQLVYVRSWEADQVAKQWVCQNTITG